MAPAQQFALEGSECKRYLEQHCYFPADENDWRPFFCPGPTYPELKIEAMGHEEKNGSTFYILDCSLTTNGSYDSRSKWRVARRLGQIREELYDVITTVCGKEAYSKMEVIPFPLRGGLPGTTAHLHEWLCSVASSINFGRAKPYIVALTLHFLKNSRIDMAMVPFLQKFGFPALDSGTWSKASSNYEWPWPFFALGLSSHEEVDGHTQYMIECSLQPSHGDDAPITWQAPRRLKQIREDWFDHLQEDWPKYADEVTEPFASRGGLPGTTVVINAWLQGICKAINTRVAPPSVVAFSLHFLAIPAAEVLSYDSCKAPAVWLDERKFGKAANEKTSWRS